jgi:hypothetical protein
MRMEGVLLVSMLEAMVRCPWAWLPVLSLSKGSIWREGKTGACIGKLVYAKVVLAT